MVLEKLGKSLHSGLQKLTRWGRVDKKTVQELVKDIQKALLQADVNVQMVLDLTERIKERALEEEPPAGVSRKEHIITIVYEEISNFLGETREINLDRDEPVTVLMVGLQGSGKTTSTAKLASFYKKRGYKPGLVCADTYRAGAYEQLKQLSEEIGVPVYGDQDGRDAVEISKNGVEKFKEESKDIILVDTAGRHQEEEALMDEMKEISGEINPDEVILVIDSTLGQQAKSQASAFKETTDVGSILVTKLDGTAKGGGALSAVSATGAPINFIGTGEKIEDIEKFKPERFVSRLLGMGDIETLLEKIEETTEPEDLDREKMRKIMSGKLTLGDFYEQLERISNMGSIEKILQMIPGIGMSIPEEEMKVGKEKLDRFKLIMQSMTEEELENPKIMNSSRIERIARGSNTSKKEVKELMEQYDKMKKMLKSFSRGRMPKKGSLENLLDEMPKDLG
ncbi:signal recognition particle [candidate division MSBL1 archaeon SCGC-AAA259I09]|uniref:Signal recognition particle 54 kDa protein n=2 Tax=candidate division MSBL1 TaxID=215777 RepID=A0A133UTF1_9EURY|nr:signal recognition particle [candidate division MSBL1 archaeon SCGC-AAA259I14]KXA98349.1 signal recognition particle [candidate division MSBL1 archaeon SCGC-AAA259I09]